MLPVPPLAAPFTVFVSPTLKLVLLTVELLTSVELLEHVTLISFVADLPAESFAMILITKVPALEGLKLTILLVVLMVEKELAEDLLY